MSGTVHCHRFGSLWSCFKSFTPPLRLCCTRIGWFDLMMKRCFGLARGVSGVLLAALLRFAVILSAGDVITCEVMVNLLPNLKSFTYSYFHHRHHHHHHLKFSCCTAYFYCPIVGSQTRHATTLHDLCCARYPRVWNHLSDNIDFRLPSGETWQWRASNGKQNWFWIIRKSSASEEVTRITCSLLNWNPRFRWAFLSLDK